MGGRNGRVGGGERGQSRARERGRNEAGWVEGEKKELRGAREGGREREGEGGMACQHCNYQWRSPT